MTRRILQTDGSRISVSSETRVDSERGTSMRAQLQER